MTPSRVTRLPPSRSSLVLTIGRQVRRAADIEPQLHGAGHLVDVLAARTGGADESLHQFVVIDTDGGRHAASRYPCNRGVQRSAPAGNEHRRCPGIDREPRQRGPASWTTSSPAEAESPNPDKPTTAKPRPGDFSTVLDRNIKALKQRRKGEDAKASAETRIAETITRFTGSMPFVYLHIVIVSIWVAANLEWISFIPAFDKTFVILATVTSVEGIFLSTFVLISQNRAAVCG